jgi:microcystin-dependent protein
MADNELPYIGEIRMFSFGVVPKNWMPCEGQLLNLQQNLELFSLLGTSYGGNGSTTFALPDLRARVPRHVEAGGAVGRPGGAVAVTLTTPELPIHNHYFNGTNATGIPAPGPTSQLSNDEPGDLYGSGVNLATMNAGMVGMTGGSEPHENVQPLLAVNFCICLEGLVPRHTFEETTWPTLS